MAAFIKKEPDAERFIKRLYGSEEFINGRKRYCLWLVDATPGEIRNMPEVMKRIEACRQDRLSAPDPGRRKLAERPSLFRETENPESFIIVPSVSSESRRYIPIDFLGRDAIPTNLVSIIPNASLYHFGILTSSIHMAWVRAVCGRLEMRYRYSAKIVYNNFPWPYVTADQMRGIETTAQKILDVRKRYPDCSLADLYAEPMTAYDLKAAHEENDAAVMALYGFKKGMSEHQIVARLFKLYAEAAGVEISKEMLDEEPLEQQMFSYVVPMSELPHEDQPVTNRAFKEMRGDIDNIRMRLEDVSARVDTIQGYTGALYEKSLEPTEEELMARLDNLIKDVERINAKSNQQLKNERSIMWLVSDRSPEYKPKDAREISAIKNVMVQFAQTLIDKDPNLSERSAAAIVVKKFSGIKGVYDDPETLRRQINRKNPLR